MKRNVVVIGSGLAGTLICNELAKVSNVTLLESGLKNAVSYPKVYFIRKDFGAVKTFCIGGGGTTNLWDNGLIPLNSEDIHSKEFAEVLIDAQRYTDRAASCLYFNKKSYSLEYDVVMSEMNAVSGKIGVFQDGVDCLLYPKKFKKLDIDSNIRAFYAISDIEFIKQNNRVKVIKYSRGSEQFSTRPDIVIISAGAMGTPYLVRKLVSDNGRSVENFGRGFVDHPMGFVGKVKIKKELAESFAKLSLLDRGDYVCRTAVRLKSECGEYTCCAFFRPALTMQNDLSIYKYKSLLGASKGNDRIKNALSLKIFHPDILAEIYSHLFRVNIRSRIYNILLIFEQKRGKNSVSFEGADIKVDWRITEEEIAVYNGVLKKLTSMLLDVSDELNIRETLTEEWLWSAAHHSGTVPLGSMPDGLIDKDLKLNSCDNVFICDGSVIQEHSYANTGLTIGQFAIRLAEKVSSILQ